MWNMRPSSLLVLVAIVAGACAAPGSQQSTKTGRGLLGRRAQPSPGGHY